jgi:hypothetical protein
MVATEDHV